MTDIGLAQWEERERLATLAAFAAGVAEALGGGWGTRPGWCPGTVFLEHADRRCLGLMLQRSGPVALVSGVYPARWLTFEELPEIGVSTRRDPVAAAEDIRRRLLGRYEALLKTALASAEADRAAAEDAERVLAQVAGAVPGSRRHGFGAVAASQRVLLPAGGWRHHADVVERPGGTRVNIELHDLEPQVAMRLLQALAAELAGE